jgi:hypothetical protein
MKKIVNIMLIAIVLYIIVITSIVLKAYFSNSIGYSFSSDASFAVMLILILWVLHYSMVNKYWEMLIV